MRDHGTIEENRQSRASRQGQRMFAAVWLPQEWVETAVRWQERLRARLPGDGVRWVKPRQMHITLAFLGEVSARGQEQAAAALQRAVADRPPFAVGGGTLGAFPHWGRPQVLWMGIGRGEAQLIDLAERVRGALAQEGLWFDPKPFRAHITLARLSRPLPRRVVYDLEALELPAPGEQWVSEVVLASSRLGPGGPHYREEVRVRLQGGAGKE